MKRIVFIILIFCHVTLLFAQNLLPSSKFREIIYFKPGGGVSISKSNVEITGELISIKLKQKLNPETGFTSEVVFKPFEKSLISYMNSEYKDLMDSVSETGDYNDDIAASFKEGLDKFISTQTW